MNQKYFIGVDISKAKIDIAIMTTDFNLILERCIENKQKKIVAFIKAFQKKYKVNHDDMLICCESTGVYTNPLMLACSECNLDLWVEHALKIKRASIDMRGKSDQLDAKRITEYAVRYQDRKKLYNFPPKVMKDLDTLSKIRESLLSQKVAIQNNIREAKSHDSEKHDLLTKHFKDVLKSIVKELLKVEESIDSIITSCSETKKNVELLTSIPGIGKRNAIQTIISTNNFRDFDSPDHLACYAGVVPFKNESGSMVKRPRVSKMASMKLKSLLHMAAVSASRSNSDLKQYYIRKVSEGKNKMSVLNAIRNKLVHRMWAVIERQSPYIPQEIFLLK